MSEHLLRPKEVCRLLGVSYVTLRRWIKEGKIRAVRTLGGKYRILESEVERLLSGVEVGEIRAIIYVRVSPSDQKKDLERQIQYLTQYCSAKGYKVIDVLSDIASGLKTDRRGLLKLFHYVVNKDADEVVVTYKDRLTRFGFEYLEYFFKQYGVRIEVVYGEERKDAYQELVEDLLAIVTSFTGKLYGMRSHKKKEARSGFQKAPRGG